MKHYFGIPVTAIVLFCIDLWDLQHKLVDAFYTTWRKAIRRLFGLPRNAHCNLLPIVAAGQEQARHGGTFDSFC